MIRPTLEVADIIRAQGEHFIERSRSWLTWAQRKVLSAIAALPHRRSGRSPGPMRAVAAIAPSPTNRVLWEVLPNGECAVS